MVYFMINWRKHCVLKRARWLVTSTDTDKPMAIPVAMGICILSSVDTGSNPLVDVTVEYVVQGHIGYLVINRMLEVSCVLRDGSEDLCPPVEDTPWQKGHQKVFFFVLV